jgi:hypothetical protein
MAGTALPDTITADTTGFVKSSIGFFITDGDGKTKKDYTGSAPVSSRSSTAAPLRGAGAYTLNFYGECATESDYRAAKILSFSYWMPGVKDPYVQEFGTAGVSVSEGTDADVERYRAEVEEEEEKENVTNEITDKPSSGGCDAGVTGIAALLALWVLTAGKRRR